MLIELDKHEISDLLDALAIASETAAGNMTDEYVRTYQGQIPDWQDLYNYLTEVKDNV